MECNYWLSAYLIGVVLNVSTLYFYNALIRKYNIKHLHYLEEQIKSLEKIKQLKEQIKYDNIKISKIYNIITNLSLYTQRCVIGPHNVEKFIEILENDYLPEFNKIVDSDFEIYKNGDIGYNPDLTELVNKHRMWIYEDIEDKIFTKLRNKFNSIVNTE